MALIVPYWVNEILRAFAFRIIFGSGGLINAILHGLGLIDQPIDFLRANVGALCRPGLRLSAGDDLPALQRDREPGPQPDRGGARPGRPLVAHPQARGHPLRQARHRLGLHHGLHAGGGRPGGAADPGRSVARLWFTPIIYRTFFQSVNWPRGAAYAFILLVACTALVLLMMRLFKVRLGEIGR